MCGGDVKQRVFTVGAPGSGAAGIDEVIQSGLGSCQRSMSVINPTGDAIGIYVSGLLIMAVGAYTMASFPIGTGEIRVVRMSASSAPAE